MEITKTRDNDTLTIAIAGEIEAFNADELEQSVLGSLDGVNNLILDLKDLEYIASAGLRVILEAKKAMGREKGFKIINTHEDVMDVFEMVGFLDIIDFG